MKYLILSALSIRCLAFAEVPKEIPAKTLSVNLLTVTDESRNDSSVKNSVESNESVFDSGKKDLVSASNLSSLNLEEIPVEILGVNIVESESVSQDAESDLSEENSLELKEINFGSEKEDFVFTFEPSSWSPEEIVESFENVSAEILSENLSTATPALESERFFQEVKNDLFLENSLELAEAASDFEQADLVDVSELTSDSLEEIPAQALDVSVSISGADSESPLQEVGNDLSLENSLELEEAASDSEQADFVDVSEPIFDNPEEIPAEALDVSVSADTVVSERVLQESGNDLSLESTSESGEVYSDFVQEDSVVASEPNSFDLTRIAEVLKDTFSEILDVNLSSTEDNSSELVQEEPVPTAVKEIPSELYNQYTLNGRIPVIDSYQDDSYLANEPLFYSKAEIDQGIEKVQRGEVGQYGMTDIWLYETLTAFPIEGKEVAIIGSMSPWYESIVIAFGGRPTTIGRNAIATDDPRLAVTTADAYKENPKKFDLVLCISSLQHEGLGRYADPLNPRGDVDFMDMAKKVLLKAKGKMILAIPVGQDALIWNLHRIYGLIRLPLLLSGWQVLETFGLTTLEFKRPLGSYGDQPILYLAPKR